MKIIAGEPIQILKMGQHNNNAGPDFENGIFHVVLEHNKPIFRQHDSEIAMLDNAFSQKL